MGHTHTHKLIEPSVTKGGPLLHTTDTINSNGIKDWNVEVLLDSTDVHASSLSHGFLRRDSQHRINKQDDGQHPWHEESRIKRAWSLIPVAGGNAHVIQTWKEKPAVPKAFSTGHYLIQGWHPYVYFWENQNTYSNSNLYLHFHSSITQKLETLEYVTVNNRSEVACLRHLRSTGN